MSLRQGSNIIAGGISIDSTPTSGSSNAVSSGGVYTALSSKASIDLDNITSTGKTNVFGCIIPNFDGNISMGLPANPTSSSGSTTFTCPKNGWIRIHANRPTAGNTLFVNINGNDIANFPAFQPAYAEFYLPVASGDVVAVWTDSTSTTWGISVQWFIPHKGA